MAVQDTRVLVEDDAPEIRKVVATVLENDGYRVETASNGAEALPKADEQEADARVPPC